MIRMFKDAYRVNLVITAVFFASVAVTGYMLFMLPSRLLIPTGFDSFISTYIVVAWTFLVGIIAVMRGMQYRRELIVYRDRADNMTQAERDSAAEARSTISLEPVKAATQSRDVTDRIQQSLNAICKQLDAGQGAFYRVLNDGSRTYTELTSGFALTLNEKQKIQYDLGEGLIGQVAATGQAIYLDEIPEGYIKIISGLGSASPRYVLIAPVKKGEAVTGVIELASFIPYTADHRKFVEQAAQLVAEAI